MRSDMSKVVTEAPRHGHGSALRVKHGGRLSRDEIEAAREDDDEIGFPQDSTKHIRRGMHPTDYKTFSDVLGPLKGYLRKQVGRPWNTVFSEMSEHLDNRTMSGRHIWTHVYQEVEVHTYLGADGKVYPCPRWRWVSEKNRWPVSGLYVHPRTGLLCYKPEHPWRHRRRAKPPVTEIVIDKRHKIERIHGLWYFCTYLPKDTYVGPRKLYVGTPHERIVTPGHWTTSYTLHQKKQLSRKELRTHGLINEVPAAPVNARIGRHGPAQSV
jgi:hypothetical protein